MGTIVGILALVMYLLGTVQGQLKPEIVDEIIPEVMSQGGSARMNCTVVNKGNYIVTWNFMDSKSGGEVISEDRNIFVNNPECGKQETKKYEVEERVIGQRRTLMLIVNCLEVVDSGRYKCYVSISGEPTSNWPSKIGYLIVQVPPTITSKTAAVLELDIGSSAELTCDAEGVPTPNVTWTKTDGSFLPSGKSLERGKVLKLTDVRAEDRGPYRCVADNNVRPPDEYLVSVKVFFRPYTRPVQNTVGQAQNRQFDAKLECMAGGYPEPEVTWYRNNPAQGQTGKVKITDHETYDIRKQIGTTSLYFGEAWYTLRVRNVKANDYTVYYCEATNRLGTNHSEIILFETFECQGANCPTIESKASVELISVPLLVAVFLASNLF